jgi:D-aspartate ligase
MIGTSSSRPLACVMGAMDIVRPLGLAGIRCHVVSPPLRPARYSRFTVGATDAVDPNRQTGELVERLVAFGAAQTSRPVLYYDNDGYLVLVSRFRHELAQHFSFVVPDAALVEDLIDKQRFLSLAARLGLPVPATCHLPVGFTEADLDLPFPLILKPLTRDDRDHAWTGVGGHAKALRFTTRSEFLSRLPQLQQSGIGFVGQALVPGPETAIESYHVYADSRRGVIAEFTGRKIRTLPSEFGHSTALITTDAPDVVGLGRQIMELIGFTGVGKFDFKRDPDGRLHLLEINPRFTLWNHLGARAGVNIPALVFGDLVGWPRPAVGPARAGVTWCDVWKDARAARRAGVSPLQWLRWLSSCDVKADMALDDPLPFLLGKVAARPVRAMSDRPDPGPAGVDAVRAGGSVPVPPAGTGTHVRHDATVRRSPSGHRDRIDVAVFDAEQRQSLVAVRSLGRRGLRVGVFGSQVRSPAFQSKWSATSRIVHDCSTDAAAFVHDVAEVVHELCPQVVIPTHDGSIEALRQNRAAFGSRTVLALAEEEPLDIAVDKSKTLELARQLDIAVPLTVLVSDESQLPEALSDVGLPAVLKPVRSWMDDGAGGSRFRAVAVVNAMEAHEAFGELGAGGRVVAVQEWLPGSREAVSVIYSDGRFHARFAQIAHRMNPPLGGSSVLRESIALTPDLVDAAEGLVSSAGLEGYSEVEFRRGADDRPRLMEINPRLSASVEIAVRTGVDFPLLLYQWAAGLPMRTQDSYTIGRRVRWLGGDLRWLRTSLQQQGRPDIPAPSEGVARFVGDFFRRGSYDYLDRSDLRPAMVATREFLRRAVRE